MIFNFQGSPNQSHMPLFKMLQGSLKSNLKQIHKYPEECTILAYRKLFKNKCISSELGGDDGKQILSWGSCIKDCPVEDFTPACEKPPPVPTFPLFDTVQTHYVSSWFKISSQKPDYKLTATRSRLHYPTWLFDSGNTTDDVEILVQVNCQSLEQDLLVCTNEVYF